MKASETGEKDLLIEEAFFDCDREKVCSNVVKLKPRDDVKTIRRKLTTKQTRTHDFVYAKKREKFDSKSKSNAILLMSDRYFEARAKNVFARAN